MADEAPMKPSITTPWVLGTTAAISAGNFAFFVMVARTFAPGAFGAFAAIAALLVLYEVPASAMQALVARATATCGPTRPVAGRGGSTGALAGDCLLAGAAVCVLVVAATPMIDALLRVQGMTWGVLLGADALPVAIALVPKGILFGSGRLRSLTTALAAGTVTKLVVGVILVHGGGGIDGAVAAIVAGEVVTAAVVVLAARRELGATPSGSGAATGPISVLGTVHWRRGANAAFAFAGYCLLAGADLLIARHWLQRQQSGTYAAAATAAQLAMWVPVTVASSLMGQSLPWRRGRSRSRRRTALAGAVVAGALLSAGIAVAARPLLVVMFDRAYQSGAGVVGLLTVATALFAVTTMAVSPRVTGRGDMAAWLPWAGVAVLVGWTWLHHSRPADIAWATLWVNAEVVAALAAAGLLDAARRRRQAKPAGAQRLLAPDAQLDLTMVMPYYNPGDLLARNLAATLEVLATTGASFEVIAVSDGSTDGSDHTIERISDPHLRRLVLPANQGKGAAVAAGLILGRGHYLGFIDADGDIDPDLLVNFVTLMRQYQPDVVLGSKRHPLSVVDYPRMRAVYSRGYQLLVHAMFRLDLRDTQTGLKLVRRDVLAAALPRMVEKRFAWDLELLVVARRLGYRRFFEAPVVLHHQFTSTVSWRAVRRTFVDTLGILYRLHVLRWYDEEHREISVHAEGGGLPVVLRLGTGPATMAWSSPRTAPAIEAKPA